MSGFRPLLISTIMFWVITGSAAELTDYSGEWIEQADDPLKISLQPIDGEHLEAQIRHGYSDEVRSFVLRNDSKRLVDESGTPRFALEHGKLRQLDTRQLVLFVRLQ